ncbi:MAG: hypothetical protein EA406_02680 [Rhodospirillales bacterium]|nr:MAG: hypothetical protein EA406_02680 [Rhodospirillales bacterium]
MAVLLILAPAGHGFAAAVVTGAQPLAGSAIPDSDQAVSADDGMTVRAATPAGDHGDTCRGAGDGTHHAGPSHDACVAGCCSAVIMAGLGRAGVAAPAAQNSALSIPPSAVRGGAHPPPEVIA